MSCHPLQCARLQAQKAAPLAPEMEQVLSTLPEAARIAARASAVASAASSAAQTGSKEPTLAELLKQQNIEVGRVALPGLDCT